LTIITDDDLLVVGQPANIFDEVPQPIVQSEADRRKIVDNDLAIIKEDLAIIKEDLAIIKEDLAKVKKELANVNTVLKLMIACKKSILVMADIPSDLQDNEDILLLCEKNKKSLLKKEESLLKKEESLLKKEASLLEDVLLQKRSLEGKHRSLVAVYPVRFISMDFSAFVEEGTRIC